MGACMSHKVEYPNEIHPNLFTVAIVGKALSVNKNGSETPFFRWSFIKSTCNNGAATSSGNSDDENPQQQGLSNADSLYASYGQLEVASGQLIYHRKGHQPVNWPLHFVRRYGYENNLFSFESGRRCRWQGVFTFRCRKAQQLFVAVQLRVQGQSLTDDGQRMSGNYIRRANVDRCLRVSLTDETSSRDDGRRHHRNGSSNLDVTANNCLSDDWSSSIVCRRRLSSSHDDVDGGDDYDDDDDDDESESNSQVFVEITPTKCSPNDAMPNNGSVSNSLIADIRRRSILDSCGSTRTLNSNTLPLLNDQVRPRSVDQLAENFGKLNNNIPNSTVETQITISLDETDALESTSAPRLVNPYYMNIDTSKPARNPSLRGASSATCIHAPLLKQQRSNRTRSISSDSKVQSQNRRDDDLFGDYYMAPCRGLSASTDGGNYVNLPAPPCDDPSHDGTAVACCSYINGQASNVEYTLVDVSPSNGDRSSPGRRSSQPESPYGLSDHSRKSSSNSGQFFNGHGASSGANVAGGGANVYGSHVGSSATLSPMATNYAQIDCTKTKALRRTAAQHRQMVNAPSTVVNPSTKYRTKSAQMDSTVSGGTIRSPLDNKFSTSGKKSTTNSCSDGVPVKRNKKDCKLRL